MKAVNSILPLVVFASLAMLGGCMPHVKVVESTESAMTPNPTASGKTLDPYTYGGDAIASGGTRPQTSIASEAGTTSNMASSQVAPKAAVPATSVKPAATKPAPAKAPAAKAAKK